MAELSAMRAGLAANIAAAFPEAQVTGYLLQNPYPPAFEIEIGAGGVVYDFAMSRGVDEWMFTVRGFVAAGTDRTAQERMDPWIASTGRTSVKAAIESDRTLGGSANDCRVMRIGQLRAFEPIASPGTSFFGAEWTVRVIAAGD